MNDDGEFGVVLVVEDDAEISSHMKARISERGHSVFSATNAREAIHFAEQHNPSLILTDLQLPTLDELLEGLRSHQTLNDVVVAIIDINHPDISHQPGLKVFVDFDNLDEFVRGQNQRAD